MRIQIIGAGPAGLYFALLMKQQDPAHEITLIERDGPDDTYGWGIVFSGRTLSSFAEADPESHAAIAAGFETWDNVDVVHRGERISVRGNRFSGIARVAFLNILQRRCLDLGVEIRFRTPVDDLAALPEADLLVGADGANSLVRRTFADAFQPTLEVGRNKYIWLGTRRLFHGLTLTFRENDAGWFAAHSYKFSRTTSTFIVECVGDAFERSGFERLSEREMLAALERVFADDLAGEPLLSNNFVRWLQFTIVRNRRWVHDNVVLLGDALHTAHFSIGSGTKLAIEDSIALARALAAEREIPAALAAFERDRKPVVDRLQAAAQSSLVWFENAGARMHLDPIPLAHELMTRSERLDDAKLRERDPGFMRRYDAWRTDRG
jgi:anthraniloyl-CoA monooxygenase